MSEENAASASEAIRQWLREVMADTGMSAATWAKRAQLAPSTIQRALKPDYNFVTSSRTLAKLAAVANRAPPEIRRVEELQLVPRYLGVRYRVQAGHWFEEDEAEQAPRLLAHPVAPHPKYAEWPQWLEEVVGDSVDLKIKPGWFAHVVDAIAMGYEPQSRNLVVVQRTRAGGLLRERTIKEVRINDGQLELCPVSSNPKWNSPVVPRQGARPGEDVTVEIVGLVVGAYMPL